MCIAQQNAKYNSWYHVYDYISLAWSHISGLITYWCPIGKPWHLRHNCVGYTTVHHQASDMYLITTRKLGHVIVLGTLGIIQSMTDISDQTGRKMKLLKHWFYLRFYRATGELD